MKLPKFWYDSKNFKIKLFDFEYNSTYTPLKCNINEFDTNNVNKYFIKDFKKDFQANGISVVKINSINKEEICQEFQKIADLIGKNPVRDATRRITKKSDNESPKISTVDPDDIHRPHSETSFSPARPAVIGFVCLDIDEIASDNGLTTIIDGLKIWRDLNIRTKNVLLSSEIEYRLSIDTPSQKKLPKGRRPWFLEYNGVKNVELDGDNFKINFDYKIPFVTEHPIERYLSIANHSFIRINTEPQIINRAVNLSLSDSNTLSFIRDDIHSNLDKNIKTFKWEKGLALFLDNYRFMHGRLPYNLKLKRNLYILQLRNFN